MSLRLCKVFLAKSDWIMCNIRRRARNRSPMYLSRAVAPRRRRDFMMLAQSVDHALGEGGAADAPPRLGGSSIYGARPRVAQGGAGDRESCRRPRHRTSHCGRLTSPHARSRVSSARVASPGLTLIVIDITLADLFCASCQEEVLHRLLRLT
jgi:hypothetical protein